MRIKEIFSRPSQTIELASEELKPDFRKKKIRGVVLDLTSDLIQERYLETKFLQEGFI